MTGEFFEISGFHCEGWFKLMFNVLQPNDVFIEAILNHGSGIESIFTQWEHVLTFHVIEAIGNVSVKGFNIIQHGIRTKVLFGMQQQVASALVEICTISLIHISMSQKGHFLWFNQVLGKGTFQEMFAFDDLVSLEIETTHKLINFNVFAGVVFLSGFIQMTTHAQYLEVGLFI